MGEYKVPTKGILRQRGLKWNMLGVHWMEWIELTLSLSLSRSLLLPSCCRTLSSV